MNVTTNVVTAPIPCVGCHTNCCKAYVVHVTAHDVFRIVRKLGIPPEDFLMVQAAREEVRSVLLDTGHSEIVLAKQDDLESCVFLIEIAGHRRCSIQAFKPSVCAVYPFTLSADGELYHREKMLCPKSWTLDSLEQFEMKKRITQWHKEYSFYDQVVENWNRARSDGDSALKRQDKLFSKGTHTLNLPRHLRIIAPICGPLSSAGLMYIPKVQVSWSAVRA